MWARFDDKTIRNRKVRRVARQDPAAALLWMFAVIYCCEQQTDGLIDGDDLRELLPNHHDDHIRVLVSGGLLHDRPGCVSLDCLAHDGLPAAGCLVVHDFSAHQMTSKEWGDFERRRKDRAKQAAHKRWHSDRGMPSVDCDLCGLDQKNKT